MPNTYWLFVLITLLLTGFVSYTTVRSARLLDHWPPDLNPLLIPGETLIRLLLIVVCIGLGYLSGRPPAQLGWRFDHALRDALWGVVGGLAAAGLIIVLTRLVVARTGHRFYRTTLLRLIVPRTGRQVGWVLLALVPVVLVEELLFRSLLIGGLAPIVPATWLVLLVGIGFGTLHSPQGLWGMAGAAAAGVALGWALLATGSLVMPVVAHYVANGAQLIIAYRLGEQAYMDDGGSPTAPVDDLVQ